MEQELLKINLKAAISPTNNVIKGMLRGIFLGMIFASVLTYIKFNDLIIMESDGNIKNIQNDTSIKPHENMEEFLHRKVRVLCFIVPISENDLKNSGHMLLATWTKRCNKFIFFADVQYEKFQDQVVELTDKRNSWTKLREAYAYIYKHHMDDFDWILRATHNSYVVMENLRWLLYQYDSDFPIVIGHRYLKEDYMKGVHALSKSAFIRLIEKAFTNSEICDQSGSDEDKELSKCLQHTNVIQIDGIDRNGRGMFFHNRPDELLFPTREVANFDMWYFHKLKQGLEHCCSQRLISIENVHGTQLYYMEYFIYKVDTFGRRKVFDELSQKLTAEEILKE